MEKKLSLALSSMSALALGCLTSCHDEDFGVTNTVLQERVFEHSFIKEFGKPSADQSWDFYALQMQAIRSAANTRATQAITVTVEDIDQPTDAEFVELANSWESSLEEHNNNAHVGQNQYTLTSTGPFKIYAVNYGGGIETQPDHEFDFGLVYIDPTDDSPHEVPLFGTGFKEGFTPTYKSWDGAPANDLGNPGWGKQVNIPVGVRFYFYMRYTCLFGDYTEAANWGWEVYKTTPQLYYSNATPQFTDYYDNIIDYSTYEGRAYWGNSTLLSTTERINVATGDDEQIMMIGLEDAWGLTREEGTFTPAYFDLDFNDVVLLIDGKLPVSDTKRFFAEDKKSFDWDYNDVVFDVSNAGIVLRAVGGTLPVWLKITDKKGGVTYTDELHELLASVQHQDIHKNHKLYYEVEVEENGQTKTKKFYKPIDVAASPGLWLDPEPIIVWSHEEGTRLERTADGTDEVMLFANPLAGSTKIGDIELIVGKEYGQSREEAEFRTVLDDEPTIIRIPSVGSIPAIWTAPTTVRWMKEFQKITLGYKDFYGGGELDHGFPQWWRGSGLNDSYWYQFEGDEDPDAP